MDKTALKQGKYLKKIKDLALRKGENVYHVYTKLVTLL